MQAPSQRSTATLDGCCSRKLSIAMHSSSMAPTGGVCERLRMSALRLVVQSCTGTSSPVCCDKCWLPAHSPPGLWASGSSAHSQAGTAARLQTLPLPLRRCHHQAAAPIAHMVALTGFNTRCKLLDPGRHAPGPSPTQAVSTLTATWPWCIRGVRDLVQLRYLLAACERPHCRLEQAIRHKL